MEYRNYMEELVMETLDQILAYSKKNCNCERCRLDAISIALNNLPPMYCVTDVGRAYKKIKAVEIQFKTDIVSEIVKALKLVKKSPRHKRGKKKK